MNIQQEAKLFLEQLFADLERHQIEIKKSWEIDHLCYRVESENRYQTIKAFFASSHKLLVESLVGGRLIATFKLSEPIVFRDWSISVVEVPAPKKNKIVKEGFEHIEVVTDLSFSELAEKYKHLPLDKNGLAKNFNPELEIMLGERNIKFHHMSLEKVIEIETSTSNC